MIKSIGMIEFNSIAMGIQTTDIMLKQSDISLIRTSTICPGKYVTIIYGDTGSVKSAMIKGEQFAEIYIVESFTIPNVDNSVIKAINGTNHINVGSAVGVLEFYSVSSAILAADEAVKAGNVSLVDIKIGFAIGGKGVVILTGNIGSIKASVNTALNSSKKTGLLMNYAILPRADERLLESLI